jgi:hypothetical protein
MTENNPLHPLTAAIEEWRDEIDTHLLGLEGDASE